MKETSTADLPSESDLHCRPYRRNWFVCFFIAGLGALLCFAPLLSPKPDVQQDVMTWYASSALGVPVLIGALFFARWMLRAEIIADAAGLRWRSQGRWKQARWQDVTDYYDRTGAKQKTFPIVKTTAGTLSLSPEMTHYAEMRTTIARRAISARARGWGRLGTRPEDDWPRDFSYRPLERRQAIGQLTWVVIGAGIYLSMILQKAPQWIGEMGWGMGLGLVATMASLLALPALLGGLLWGMHRQARQRRDQRITVSMQGIEYTDLQRHFAVAWDEVTNYSYTPGRLLSDAGGAYCVQTHKGDFDFVPLISDWKLLVEIIPRYATGIREKPWIAPNNEIVGAPEETTHGLSDGLCFRFQNRSVRALTSLLLVWAIASMLAAIISYLGLGKQPNWVPEAVISSLSFAVWVWACWRYKRAGVYLDTHGITQCLPFGKKFLAWKDVRSVEKKGSDVLTFLDIVGEEEQIRFWKFINHRDRLLAELQANAPHIVISPEILDSPGLKTMGAKAGHKSDTGT